LNNKFFMDNRCFACGKENNCGLKLKIEDKKDYAVAKFRPKDWVCGYKGIVHGGIISTLLDEIAVWAAFHQGFRSATAQLNIRIRKAMKLNEEYLIRGWVVRSRHSLIQAESEILDKDKAVIASAQVKLLKI